MWVHVVREKKVKTAQIVYTETFFRVKGQFAEILPTTIVRNRKEI